MHSSGNNGLPDSRPEHQNFVFNTASHAASLQISLNVSVPRFHKLGMKCQWEKSILHPPLAYNLGWRLSKERIRGSCVKWLITSRKRKENPEAKSDSYEDTLCNDFCIFLWILSPFYSFPLLYNQLTSRSWSSNLSRYLVLNDTWCPANQRHSTSGERAGLTRGVFLTVLSNPTQDQRSPEILLYYSVKTRVGTGKVKMQVWGNLKKNILGLWLLSHATGGLPKSQGLLEILTAN